MEKLFRPEDGAVLAVFRFLFGMLMAGEAFYKYSGMINHWYHPDDFHFTYSFFHWVEPWPGFGMQIHIIVMGLAAVGIAVGLFYRVCCIVFTLLYTHLFLIEAGTYNNHYYLIILLGLLFSVTNAHSAISLDRYRRPETLTGAIPLWNVAIFRAQIVMMYFFGGIAKLNGDWLRGEPMRYWISKRGEYPLLDPYINENFIREEWIVMFTSYGGLVFDLFIGFALLYRRTRPFAVPFLVFFHGANMFMFTIGVFPVLALCSTLLFFPGDLPRRFMARIGGTVPRPELRLNTGTARRRLVCAGLGLYMAVQILMPLRHWVYPGNVSWTEEGHAFAWHMKVREKKMRADFYVKDTYGKLVARVDSRQQIRDLHHEKWERMLTRPQLVVQYAHFLRERYEAEGVDSPSVYVDLRASLNGRPYQPLIDPETDLGSAHYSPIFATPWILPLPKDLPIGEYPIR